MQVETTDLQGVLLITPQVFEDERGHFFESYHKEKYAQYGVLPLIQFNESCSQKNVLRGLHLQQEKHVQGKLVRVLSGSIRDVAVDMRPQSETFGKYYSIVLDACEKKQLWVPPGFAHGFLSLENDTCVEYGCSAYYKPEAEMTLMWNDPDIGIDWGVSDPVLSEKDLKGQSLETFLST